MNIGTLRRRIPFLVVLLILVVPSFLVGNAVAERSSVPQAFAAEPQAPEGGGACAIQDLAVLYNRVHVRCQAGIWPANPAVIFFAVSTTTPDQARYANRYLSLLTMAWAFNRTPTVYWDDSTGANPAGCVASNCRLLTGVVFQ